MTERFCDEFVAEAENYGKWSDGSNTDNRSIQRIIFYFIYHYGCIRYLPTNFEIVKQDFAGTLFNN